MKRLVLHPFPLHCSLCTGSQAAERCRRPTGRFVDRQLHPRGPGADLARRRRRSGCRCPSVSATRTCRPCRRRSRAGTSASSCRAGRSRSPFAARLANDRLFGTVRAGAAAHGTFRARRGAAPGSVARGLYEAGGRTQAVVDDPYGPARLVDLESGAVHGLYPGGPDVPDRLRLRDPGPGGRYGSLRRGRSASCGEVRCHDTALRQLEVRFRSGDATLSGTLTLPAGPGRTRRRRIRARVGADRSARICRNSTHCSLRNGVAVLAYDKRGIGQSGGSLSRRVPDRGRHDVLARDAVAAARFLPVSAGDRSGPGRACRAQPGRLDHAAGRLTRAAHSLPRRLLGSGGDRRRERPLPGSCGPGRASGATLSDAADRRAGPRSPARVASPDPVDPEASGARSSGSMAAATVISRRACRSRPPRADRARAGPRFHHRQTSRTRTTRWSRPPPA